VSTESALPTGADFPLYRRDFLYCIEAESRILGLVDVSRVIQVIKIMEGVKERELSIERDVASILPESVMKSA